ncbi:MAG: 2-oxoglutarate dehydrogenase E1 subunit family protein, partial [Steroidobacteraceae bacterium]
MPEQLAGTALFGANASYVEALYEQYLRNPSSLGADWRAYFDALPGAGQVEQAHGPVIRALKARTDPAVAASAAAGVAPALGSAAPTTAGAAAGLS